MKTVSFEVSDEYNLPEWFSTASVNDIENALSFAAQSSTSAWKMVYSNNLELEREKLSHEHKQFQETYQNRNNHLEELYESKLQHLKEREVTLERAFAALHTESKTIEESLISCVHKPISDISEKFDALIGKKGSAFTNCEKGNFGQSFIEDQVVKYFPHAEIIDTHSQDHVGDIHVKIGNYLFMIESKNKKTIEKTDVDKFAFDVNFLKESIHGALFVSLKENVPVPTKGHIACEYINGIPAVYTTSAFNKPEIAIYTALQLLIGINNMNTQKEYQNDIENMNNELTQIAQAYDEFMKLNEENLKLANNIINNCSKQKHRFTSLDGFFERFGKKRDTELSDVEKAKQLIIDYRNNNNNQNPTRQYLISNGISQYFLRNNPLSKLFKELI